MPVDRRDVETSWPPEEPPIDFELGTSTDRSGGALRISVPQIRVTEPRL